MHGTKPVPGGNAVRRFLSLLYFCVKVVFFTATTVIWVHKKLRLRGQVCYSPHIYNLIIMHYIQFGKHTVLKIFNAGRRLPCGRRRPARLTVA